MQKNVLLIEDDEGLVLSLEDRLKGEGYFIVSRTDGESGEEEARREPYDIIILDVMLPERDGFQVCQNLRNSGILTPILMLTARTATFDRVTGLRIGADDYLAKPFEHQELLARMHALLRRDAYHRKDAAWNETTYEFGLFTLDTARQELFRGPNVIPLSTQEYRLLEYFLQNPNRVISRNELLDEVWGYDALSNTRTIDVHVVWLRQKLGEKSRPHHLVTIRGRGYRFDPE